MALRIFLASILMLMIAMAVGCSGGTTVDPIIPEISSRDADDSQHVLWGYYKMYIEPATGTIELVPARQVLIHMNVKPFVSPPACMDCLKVQPTAPFQNNILPLDVSLKNPTDLTGHDVRGILISDDAGAYLLNPDNYTDLYDTGEPIKINPFKAFAKADPERAFGPGETNTEFYELFLSGFGKIAVIDYAIDASWPGRAKEPYLIVGPNIIGELDDLGLETATVQVEVFASGNDVDEVLLDLSEIGFDTEIPMVFDSGALWTYELTNDNLIGEGQYTGWCRASTSSSNKYLYAKFTLIIIPGTLPISLTTDVMPIFDDNCTICHGSVAPPLGLDLSLGNAYSNLVGVDSVQSDVVRIDPFNSFNSYLMAKIIGLHLFDPFNGSGDQMPKNAAPLSEDDIKTIGLWIDEGALDN